MNTFSTLLAAGAAHATGFALLGILVYLVWRRWSPAAGAQAALATLSVMAAVGLLACLPLRGWSLPRRVPAAPAPSSLPRPLAATATSPPREPDWSAPAEGVPWMGLMDPLVDAISRLESVPPTPLEAATRSRASWLGLAMLAGLAIGLLRLATGLWSMRGLVARSRPIEDVALNDLLEVLRAEMGCVRPVRLRLAPDLASPATIGLGRPLILLPSDWEGWDEDERRAVLAHELAHVCRGDFAAGLLAQLSLAIQFYHPLAHWILARHRLDQELAADAWSARLSGGNPSYLAVLARMALRQDDRAVTWPARAFLPSRGTLIRRIEMLRRKRPVRHARLSTPVRLATFVALGGLGVLVAGLRAPSASGQAPAPAATNQPAPAAQPFDLKYLPAETRVILAIQPAAMLGRPELAPLRDAIQQLAGPGAKLPVPPESLEQVLLFWEGNLTDPGPGGPRSPAHLNPSGAVVRTKGPEFTKALVAHLLPGAETKRHSGQTYLEPARGGTNSGGLCAYQADGPTIVFAREDLLLSIIDDREVPAPEQAWDEAWRQVQPAPIAMAVDGRWLRRAYNRMITAGNGSRHTDPTIEMVSPLVEKVHAYALGLGLDGELRVELVARVARADDMKSVRDTMQAVLTLARNALPAMKQGATRTGRFAEANSWGVATLEGLIEKASLEAAGQAVHLKSSVAFDAATSGRTAAVFLTTARSEAGRTQSANNLKQIALAMHNYADQNGHFPMPVLYGGRSGKVPFSWRVALLPFLEQNELYREYNFDEPWDGPNNIKLLDRMPRIYAHPGPTRTDPKHSSYFVFSGPEAILGKEGGTDFADITDGTSNTILAIEANRPVPWTKPEDIPFDGRPDAPLPQTGGFNPDGFNACFGDGSVRFIRAATQPHVLRALITRKGGEVISSDSF